MENPFDSKGFAGFWLRVEREWAEEEKRKLYYWGDYGLPDQDEDDEELCDYTGDLCIGDKLFCEECPVFDR